MSDGGGMSIGQLEEALARVFADAPPIERAKFALAVAERHWFWVGGEGEEALAALRKLEFGDATRMRLQAKLRRAAEIAADPDRIRASDEVALFRLLDVALTGDVVAIARAAIATHGSHAERVQEEIVALSKLALHPRDERSETRSAIVTPARAPERWPRACSMDFNGATLRVVETAGGSERFRVLLDGRPCRVRHRKLVYDEEALKPESSWDWIEGDDGSLGTLVECVSSEDAKRTEDGARLVVEEHHAGLSGFDADTKIVVSLAGPDLVEVDMMYRVNPLNPYFGW